MVWLIRIAAVLGVAVIAVGTSAFATWQGWLTRAAPVEVLADQLRPHMRIFKPDGAGPFPTVIQFHGCGSAVASQDEWAAFFTGHGYAAIVVDSLSPRGIAREEALLTVCTGLQLTSLERAGDVLAALEAARAEPFVDERNLFLAGWSHGGWSIMDLLSMDLETEAPPNLDTASSESLAPVRGAILIYPYCGFPARSLRQGWATPMPTVMLMGAEDTVAPARACLPIAERLGRDGIDIDTFIYSGAVHDFDVSRHERFHRGRYDETTTLAAREEALRFIARHITE